MINKVAMQRAYTDIKSAVTGYLSHLEEAYADMEKAIENNNIEEFSYAKAHIVMICVGSAPIDKWHHPCCLQEWDKTRIDGVATESYKSKISCYGCIRSHEASCPEEYKPYMEIVRLIGEAKSKTEEYLKEKANKV